MRNFLGVVFVLLLTGLISGKPDRKVETPKDKSTIPNVTMNSNWGTITQSGGVLSVKGNPSWRSEGKIKDGIATLLWTEIPFNRPAIGVYKAMNQRLEGYWGYANEVRLNEDGTLSGSVHPEELYPVKPSEEDP